MTMRSVCKCLFLLTLCWASAARPLNAQHRDKVIPAPSQQLDGFREDLRAYMIEMSDLGTLLAENTAANPLLSQKYTDIVSKLATVQAMVPQLTLSDLYVLREAMAGNADWRDNPKKLKGLFTTDVLQKIRNYALATAVGASDSGKGSAGRVRELVAANCNPVTSGTLDLVGIYIAKGVALAAEIAHELIPDDTLAIPNAIAVGIWGAAEGVALGLEATLEVDKECDDKKFEIRVDDNFATVIAKLDQIIAMLNDIINRLIALQAAIDEILARQIEESVDLCRPLVSIALPAANGGRLEYARDLTQVFITNSATAAGVLPGPLTGLYLTAQNYHGQGVNSMTLPNKRYKEAFQFFCKAYASVVRAMDTP